MRVACTSSERPLRREHEQRRAQVRRVQQQRERARGDAVMADGALRAPGESARCELCRTRRSSARRPAGACARARSISRGGSEYGASLGRWSISSALDGCGRPLALRRRHVQLTGRHVLDADGQHRHRRSAACGSGAALPVASRCGSATAAEATPATASTPRRAIVTIPSASARRRVPGAHPWGDGRQMIRTGVPSGTTRAIQRMFDVVDAHAAVRAPTSRADRPGSCRRDRGSPRGPARRRS